MLTRHLACGLGALVLLLAFGCAGQSPTAGDPPSGAATPPDGPRPLGHYTLLVNNGQASLTPAVHGQALGDSRPFDATQYFRSTPCHDCARIAAVGLTADGKVAVDVAIRHPFRNTETRKDLDVFDVRGILGVQPAVTFPSTPGILGKPLSTDPNALL
ncbi:MAG TPA: hypothetical protein VEI97_17345, partial [bacterium]|nr:hypothetical protein [bacterium]